MGREPRVSASSVVESSLGGHVQRICHPQSSKQTEFPQCHLCTPPSVCSVLPYFAANTVLDWVHLNKSSFVLALAGAECRGASEGGG